MKIAIIGAGNGGQALAGYLSMCGHHVVVQDIDKKKIATLNRLGVIHLQGKINGDGYVKAFTSDISQAVVGAELILVCTVANAHQDVAKAMAPLLSDNQVIVLNPGRTCGALVFRHALQKSNCQKRIYIAEAQTLVYACRTICEGTINIIGIKDEVFLSALPASDTDFVMEKIHSLFPCFKKVPNVLHTSMENIGAMFHPCVCLFNAATIERQEEFWFYRDMTQQVARFIEQLDKERLAVGKAYGLDLISVYDWIKTAYKDTTGDTLCERLRNNPAYHDIKAPGSIFTRQLTEDIPTGILPILELGKAAGISCPLMKSILAICQTLLNMDLEQHGRTLANMGMGDMNKDEILRFIEQY